MTNLREIMSQTLNIDYENIAVTFLDINVNNEISESENQEDENKYNRGIVVEYRIAVAEEEFFTNIHQEEILELYYQNMMKYDPVLYGYSQCIGVFSNFIAIIFDFLIAIWSLNLIS